MISVIVPIYNVEKYLKKCVDSICSQSYQDLEIILVDDGSTDSCPKIIDEYASVDKRIKPIHKSNGGLVSARQTGLTASTGEFVAYVDGDDWIMENYVETLFTIISKYDVDLVCCAATFYFKNRTLEWKKPYRVGLYDKNELISEIFPTLIQGPKLDHFQNSAWGKLFKREMLIPHQMNVNSRIVMGEDLALTKPYIASISSMYITNECLYCYNCMNSESITKAKKCLSWEGPRMIASILFELNSFGIYDFKPQIDRYLVHSLFNVAISQFNSGKTYRETALNICSHLQKEDYARAVDKAYFSSWKGKLAKYILKFKLICLLYVYWKRTR